MIKAERKDKPIAIDILVEAFDNPTINNSINFIVKNDKYRKKRLRKLMAFQFDMAMLLGTVFFSDNKKACVLYIHRWKFSLKRIFLEIKLLFTVIGVENLFRTLKREKLLKSFHPKEPYIHLWLMGVCPSEQGKGIGSELIKGTINIFQNQEVTALT